MTVFNLDESNGSLSLSQSFKVLCTKNNSGITKILALTESHVFIGEDYGAAGGCVNAFDLIPSSFEEDFGEVIAKPVRALRFSDDCRFGASAAAASLGRNGVYFIHSGGIEVFLCNEPQVME